MAKWLRDYLSFGGRKPPPQPPTPDYTESDILRAYREQKDLDFEDPYEDADGRPESEPAGPVDSKYDSPRHRLIKVEAVDMARAKALVGSPGEEVRGGRALVLCPHHPRVPTSCSPAPGESKSVWVSQSPPRAFLHSEKPRVGAVFVLCEAPCKVAQTSLKLTT